MRGKGIKQDIMFVPQGERPGEVGGSVFHGDRVSVWEKEKVLEIMVADRKSVV